MQSRYRAVAMTAMLAWAATGLAADKDGRLSGEEVARILQEEGYQAKLDVDREGDPKIQSRMSGLNTYVLFYDCKDGRCGSLQFSVALDLEAGTTLAVANRFNRDFRYARLYLDQENDPFLQFDFEITHADAQEHIASQIAIWEDLLAEFMDATGYRDEREADKAQRQAPGDSATPVRRAGSTLGHRKDGALPGRDA